MNLDFLPARSADMAAEETLHFADRPIIFWSGGQSHSESLKVDRDVDLRLRCLHIPIHHIAEHTTDRKIFRILLGDEPGKPILDIPGSE